MRGSHLTIAIKLYWRNIMSVVDTACATHIRPSWAHVNDPALLAIAVTAMHARTAIQQSIQTAKASREQWQQIAKDKQQIAKEKQQIANLNNWHPSADNGAGRLPESATLAVRHWQLRTVVRHWHEVTPQVEGGGTIGKLEPPPRCIGRRPQ